MVTAAILGVVVLFILLALALEEANRSVSPLPNRSEPNNMTGMLGQEDRAA
jgi:hypothetical protein